MNDLFDPSLLNLSGLESDAEFIPLTTAEEEETVNNQEFPDLSLIHISEPTRR